MTLNPDLIRARCGEIDAALTRLDFETCSSMYIGPLTTTKSMTSSVPGSMIFACSRLR